MTPVLVQRRGALQVSKSSQQQQQKTSKSYSSAFLAKSPSSKQQPTKQREPPEQPLTHCATCKATMPVVVSTSDSLSSSQTNEPKIYTKLSSKEQQKVQYTYKPNCKYPMCSFDILTRKNMGLNFSFFFNFIL